MNLFCLPRRACLRRISKRNVRKRSIPGRSLPSKCQRHSREKLLRLGSLAHFTETCFRFPRSPANLSSFPPEGPTYQVPREEGKVLVLWLLLREPVVCVLGAWGRVGLGERQHSIRLRNWQPATQEPVQNPRQILAVCLFPSFLVCV